ncbi:MULTISPECIES: hypothetical protein [unclassified Streptomyces]|uniref:hypothetical protein n=1 Tax=unclassified Streptomyces TaxID=2593676 RepID=UPI0006ADA294|nr:MULTISPECIES: hypothetical protein [unclassified Streptomyces]KOX27693.1 hypothetical protein ADL06_14450 [Streptomyces sp. NRRL F-6491]KOX36296.1 hypothetical protein ADL08_32640 [Streptomyces sp. NRRL F-6492]
MITLHPVLEIRSTAGFDLWPVAALAPYGLVPLNGDLTPAGVGTAVMSIAKADDVEAEDGPRRPSDPPGPLLHGLLALDDLFVPGGLRVTDTATGVVLSPGCRNGLEERGDRSATVDGDGPASFGHDPSPVAERIGDRVRLTADADREDGPVIDLPLTDLRRLLATAEHDLRAFLHPAATWTTTHLPTHAPRLHGALARALDLPG